MKERREFERWDIPVSCQCDWQEDKFDARVLDLSFSGARLGNAPRLPLEGSVIELRLPDRKQQVSLLGRVVHRQLSQHQREQEGFFGVKFAEPRPERGKKLLPILHSFIVNGTQR